MNFWLQFYPFHGEMDIAENYSNKIFFCVNRTQSMKNTKFNEVMDANSNKGIITKLQKEESEAT